MEKPFSRALTPFLLAFAVVLATEFPAPAQQPAVTTVSSVDLKRYSGKWYEIAKYPNKFQKSCVGNTTAEYFLEQSGDLKVVNRCLKKDGKTELATGKAKIEDKQSNAKLEVRFAPSALSFLPQVWGDYWILDLDQNYQYAAVGDPKREYLWILSRQPQMDEAIYQQVLRRLEQMGFQPNKLIKTPQGVESLKGTIVKQ